MRNIKRSLVLADDGKAAIQRPQTPVGAIENPDTATGRGRHIKGDKINSRRPHKLAWRPAMKKIEDQKSFWLQHAYNQKMQFGHNQATKGQRLLRRFWRQHGECSILGVADVREFILRSPKMSGGAGSRGIYEDLFAGGINPIPIPKTVLGSAPALIDGGWLVSWGTTKQVHAHTQSYFGAGSIPRE